MRIGDWVIGNYFGGTKFIGYIEDVEFNEDFNDELYTINLIKPHVSQIKRTIIAFSPLETEVRPEDLSLLIDLALLTKDKEWFDQLSNKLCELSL